MYWKKTETAKGDRILMISSECTHYEYEHGLT